MKEVLLNEPLKMATPRENAQCVAWFIQINRIRRLSESTELYSNMWRHAQLNDLQPTIIFQQDGAPPYWGLLVRGFLNETFPDRWIGRDGPIPWPPCSPDITPLDFFLWGYVKDIVYRTQIRDITDLKQRIT